MQPATTPTATTSAETTPTKPRRRSRAFTVVVVIVSLLAGVVVGRRLTADRDEPISLAGEKLFADLPAQLSPPDQVPDLPGDRGVGLAALLYHRTVDAETYDPSAGTFKQNDVYLVTRSGEHFRVGRTPADTAPLNMSMSPDGRWLGYKRGGEWRVRDVSGTAVYRAPEGAELSLWSTDARSLLLATPSGDKRTFSTMDLPGGTIRPVDVRTANPFQEVALIAGHDLAVSALATAAVDAARPVSVTLHDLRTGATRDLPVVSAEALRPGETAGPVMALFHAGGNPASIWVEVGRPDLWPTDSPEGMLAAPTVSLAGVDVATGAALARIETTMFGSQSAELCRGVVSDGVVIQRWTRTTTELIVVDPRSNARRTVTSFPWMVNVIVPGARM